MKAEQGAILAVVLVVMFASLAIATSWASFANLSFKKTLDQEGEERAFQVAEAGIDQVLAAVSGGCSMGGMSGTTAVQTLNGGTYQASIGGGTIDVIGWYGSQCQRVSGSLSSYFGLLGGPFYYKTGVTHDTQWHGPCPTRPTADAPIACEAEYSSDFDSFCGLVENGDANWSLIAGSSANVDCTDHAVECLTGGALYEVADTNTTADSITSVLQRDGSDTGALAARIQADSSRYETTWNDPLYGMRVCKYVGGALDICSESSPGFQVEDGAIVGLRVIGNEASAIVDGIVVATLIDDATTSTLPPISSAGNSGMGIGIGSFGCSGTGSYDDFEVESL